MANPVWRLLQGRLFLGGLAFGIVAAGFWAWLVLAAFGVGSDNPQKQAGTDARRPEGVVVPAAATEIVAVMDADWSHDDEPGAEGETALLAVDCVQFVASSVAHLDQFIAGCLFRPLRC